MNGRCTLSDALWMLAGICLIFTLFAVGTEQDRDQDLLVQDSIRSEIMVLRDRLENLEIQINLYESAGLMVQRQKDPEQLNGLGGAE